MHKDLAQVVSFLRESPKVKSFDIVTNATLDFKEDVLEALKDARKAWVTISDYSASPNLAVPLRKESIIASLKEHKVRYFVSSGDGQNRWWDPGRICKRNRSQEDVIRNYRSCLMNYAYPNCNSVMSAECAKDSSLAPLGAAFICATASALSRLKGLREFEGDFIDIAAATKERIIGFYAQDYFKACDCCQDMWEEKRYITPAVQTRDVFSVEQGQELKAYILETRC